MNKLAQMFLMLGVIPPPPLTRHKLERHTPLGPEEAKEMEKRYHEFIMNQEGRRLEEIEQRKLEGRTAAALVEALHVARMREHAKALEKAERIAASKQSPVEKKQRRSKRNNRRKKRGHR